MSWRFRSPLQLLADLGISQPEEIDIEVISEYCDATVLYEPLSGCEARIVGGSDEAYITVNSNSLRERQRFSAAHELGHWMRDHGHIAAISCDAKQMADWFQQNPEYRANRYAADLLLPDNLFRPRARNRPIVLDTVRDLAAEFQTSLLATAVRLVELGSYPAVVRYEPARGRSWWTSSSLPRSLMLLEAPGQYSEVRAIAGGRPAKGPTEVPAKEWFAGVDRRNELIEDTLQTKYGTLTLLSFPDERWLVEIETADEE